MEKLKIGKKIEMRRHISAGTIIYRRSGKNILEIFLLYQSQTETWHLPKGTVEDDESMAETALRETREETGLEVKLNGYVGKLESLFERGGSIIPKDTHYYLAEVIGGSLRQGELIHRRASYHGIDQAIQLLTFDTIAEKEYQIVQKAVMRIQELMRRF